MNSSICDKDVTSHNSSPINTVDCLKFEKFSITASCHTKIRQSCENLPIPTDQNKHLLGSCDLPVSRLGSIAHFALVSMGDRASQNDSEQRLVEVLHPSQDCLIAK